MTGHAARAFVLFASLTLGGCIGTTALSGLGQVRPLGGPFSQALYSNYAFLARSFGDVGMPRSGSPFDVDQSINVGSTSLDVADVANTFAQKAIMAANGDDVLPEPSSSDLFGSEGLRLRLLRALDQGRDKAPTHAARAQADFDCWVVNARAERLHRASAACLQSLRMSLARLEQDLAPPPPAAPTTPVEQTQAAPQAPQSPLSPAAPPPDTTQTGPSQ
ncbi:MAG TPA: hypothetical protein VLV55_02160 [Rhizomicrobium sp.]|nr:hypothetical protein [Rhizomicrobium sp.]